MTRVGDRVVFIAEPTSTLTHVLTPNTPDAHIVGVGTVGNRIYVLHHKARQQIQVYNSTTFAPEPHIPVQGLRRSCGLASCVRNNCLFVSDCENDCLCRIQLSGSRSLTGLGKTRNCENAKTRLYQYDFNVIHSKRNWT